MRSRSFIMATAVVIVASFAACGGGGGGGGGTPPAPTPTPVHTATPTPAPTLNPFGCVGSTPSAATVKRKPMVVYPIAPGDTFSYSGTLSDVFTQSAPCPQPTATNDASVTVNVSVSATAPPAGASDATSVESDAYAKQTTTITTHQTLVENANALLLYATSSSDTIGNTITTTYVTPQTLDQLSGGTSWSNQPAASISEHLADGTSVSRTVKNDGSYTDTEHFPGAAPATITVDGAANGKPLDGGGSYAFGGVTFTYAPPSGGNITVTITSGTSKKTRTFPAWFNVPSSYITDTFSNNGQQPFDPNCHTAGAISPSADHQVVETYQVLDPVLGYKEKRVTTSYVVSGFGAACVKIDDTLSSFYDYQSDTTRIDYQSQNGQPNSVDHLVEYLGMTSPTVPYPAVRRQSIGPVSAVTVAHVIAAITHERTLQRAQQLRNLHSYALHVSGTGATR